MGKKAFDYYWRRSDVQEVIGSAESRPTEDELEAVSSAAREPGGVWLVVSHSRDLEGRIPTILDRSSRTPGKEVDFVGIRVIPFH